jgi:hypothetical protein
MVCRRVWRHRLDDYYRTAAPWLSTWVQRAAGGSSLVCAVVQRGRRAWVLVPCVLSVAPRVCAGV